MEVVASFGQVLDQDHAGFVGDQAFLQGSAFAFLVQVEGDAFQAALPVDGLSQLDMGEDLGVGQVELEAVAADGCQRAFALVVGVLRDLDGAVALNTELHGSGQRAIAVDAAFFGKLVFLAHDQFAGELLGGIARGPRERGLAGIGELAGERQLGACKGLALIVNLGDGKVGALVVEAHIYGLRMLLLGDAELHLFSAQDGAVDGFGFLEVIITLFKLVDCDDAFAVGCKIGLDGGAVAFAVQVEPDVAGERIVRAVDGLGQLHAA